jgi:hypothetical protein
LFTALVMPGSAFVIGGVDYVLFAKTAVLMQPGPLIFVGNIGVNDAGGLLRVGARNLVLGTVTADRLRLGVAALADTCEFNTPLGGDPATACGTQASAALPLSPTWPPFAIPDVDPCVGDRGNDFTVEPGEVVTLPAGACFGHVRVKRSGILVLSAGAPFNFESVRLEDGSLLDGRGAVLTVKGQITTARSVTISAIGITTLARGMAIGIGAEAALADVLLAAPNGTVQVHRGVVVGPGVEILATRIIVAPITFAIPN